MKKFYTTMVAMLCGVAAMAQEQGQGLYANDIKVEKGETTVSLPISLRNDDPVTAFSFRLGLPEGVTMALNNKGKKYVTIDEDRMEDHTSILQVAADGADMISIYDPGVAPFYENDGVVVTVPLAITEEVAAVDGTYEIRLYEISVSTPDAKSLTVAGIMPTEATCSLVVGSGTGIVGINAADSKAPIYNVAGQRVSKAQKGVFIQNGKKVAVK